MLTNRGTKPFLAVAFSMSLVACGGGGSSPTGTASRSLVAAADRAPNPDLCGSWEAVELSVTSPPPDRHRHGEDEVTATHTFCRPISVIVPARLDVVGGPSPDGVATVSFRSYGGPPRGRALDTCRYRADRGKAAAPGLRLDECTRGLKAGASITAQTFTVEVELEVHDHDPPSTVRVALGSGTPPAADAYREHLGTTANLAGVVLREPASGATAFSGIGLADGPPFALHQFVSDPPTGSLVVGPSVDVTGTGPFPPGVRLTVPFDAAWAATLPPGSTSTVTLKQLQQANVALGAIEAVPLADASTGAGTIEAGLSSPGAMLTTIRDLTPISFHGGALMNNGLNVYLIWAGDFDGMAADDPRPPLRRFLGDLPGSVWYDILGTYGITNRGVRLAGERVRKDLTTVTDPYVDAVKPALDDGTFANDLDGIYIVVAASNVTFTDRNYCSHWCGWHASTTLKSQAVKYAIIGSPASCGSCRPWQTTTNGSNVDSVISIVAHEMVETVTNPTGHGWYGHNAGVDYGQTVENADKCAWIFLSSESAGSPPSLHNMSRNGDLYFVQGNWVNAEDGYCGMGIESVQIAATPPSGGLALNEVGHFSVAVTNTGPVLLSAHTLTVTGVANGFNGGESVPVGINQDLHPGESVTIDVPVQAPLEIAGNTQIVDFEFRVRDPGNLHTFGAVGRTSLEVRRALVLLDKATCLGVSIPPSVNFRTLFPVTMTFKNVGTTAWLAGEYRLVGMPVDVVNTYLQTPQVLGKTVLPNDQVDLTFWAWADVDYGETYNVAAGMANAAAFFLDICGGTTVVSTLGAPCSAGVGACKVDGTKDAAGNCNAVAGAPDDTFHAAPDPRTGSWDWNCNGVPDHQSSRVCTALVSELDPTNPGLCVWSFPLTETADLSRSCIGVDDCDCAVNAIPDCGQPGSFSVEACRPGDPICIDLICTDPAPGTEGCK